MPIKESPKSLEAAQIKAAADLSEKTSLDEGDALAIILDDRLPSDPFEVRPPASDVLFFGDHLRFQQMRDTVEVIRKERSAIDPKG